MMWCGVFVKGQNEAAEELQSKGVIISFSCGRDYESAGLTGMLVIAEITAPSAGLLSTLPSPGKEDRGQFCPPSLFKLSECA